MCNQAFKPLHISTSNIYLNIYLNLKLNRNGFITYIIPDAFLSYPIHLIHDFRPSLHQPSFYVANQSQVQAYILVRPGGYWSTHQKAFIILVKALTFYRRQSWRPHKREVLIASSKAFIHTSIKGCLRVIHLTTQPMGDFMQEG